MHTLEQEARRYRQLWQSEFADTWHLIQDSYRILCEDYNTDTFFTMFGRFFTDAETNAVYKFLFENHNNDDDDKYPMLYGLNLNLFFQLNHRLSESNDEHILRLWTRFINTFESSATWKSQTELQPTRDGLLMLQQVRTAILETRLSFDTSSSQPWLSSLFHAQYLAAHSNVVYLCKLLATYISKMLLDFQHALFLDAESPEKQEKEEEEKKEQCIGPLEFLDQLSTFRIRLNATFSFFTSLFNNALVTVVLDKLKSYFCLVLEHGILPMAMAKRRIAEAIDDVLNCVLAHLLKSSPSTLDSFLFGANPPPPNETEEEEEEANLPLPVKMAATVFKTHVKVGDGGCFFPYPQQFYSLDF